MSRTPADNGTSADTAADTAPGSLLDPIPGDDPCGPSLRYDRTMAEIRLAREADDPTLPMGEWERPLKVADWPRVAELCTTLLARRSKDLQAAAWLLEARLHLHQLDGLETGIHLVTGLVERYWDGLHPRIDDDGDCDVRVAPLAWLNETLPRALRLQVVLMPLPGHRPSRLTFDDWERLARNPEAIAPDDDRSAPPDRLPPRDELLRLAGQRSLLPTLIDRRDQVRDILAAWGRLDTLLDGHLGLQGPSLGRVADTLRLLERSFDALIAGRTAHGVPTPGTGPMAGDVPVPSGLDALGALGSLAAFEAAPEPVSEVLPAQQAVGSMRLRSRQAAYDALEAVADYLQATEPHSPTPYLIRRAIKWGRMSLPDLMQEVLREEGDLNRLFSMLGLKPDAN